MSSGPAVDVGRPHQSVHNSNEVGGSDQWVVAELNINIRVLNILDWISGRHSTIECLVLKCTPTLMSSLHFRALVSNLALLSRDSSILDQVSRALAMLAW
ncbi:hypothetical protein Nepgr_005093 [Nepenthes gracilis]|uniref:Uncharacterized protein n=1 Tax=Nepenthes gracilis TaxID=150966 RepID=A0AAD3XFW9_NEPGR|nr:hypothetical protein Nepgr_005093 [Nepenthes gracilis]